jgi:flagellar biosynthesis GTPase FlhF
MRFFQQPNSKEFYICLFIIFLCNYFICLKKCNYFIVDTDGMNWVQRVNVIHEVAKLLKFIHDQEKHNMVLNISASHILLDKVISTLPWQSCSSLIMNIFIFFLQ